MRGFFVVLSLAVIAPVAAAGNPPPHLAAYKADAKAEAVARALYDDYGDVATVGAEEDMDGGYRGKIHLVPELPIKTYRKHLEWVAAAMKAFDDFFAAFDSAPSYRWKQLTFQFVRSIKKRTPSAYATGWSITHNVAGSLLTSERGVRETYFHELFHLNDFDHGDWSAKALGKDYAAIVKKCGTNVKCLAPFAPNDTKVRATGTYYAFQPNNGNSVHEYAAELAVRYFKEQTEMATAKKLSRKAFKCGPSENARAWRSLVDEFFAGRDLVPACG
ncbi:MAG TPA: hypothetical protein VIV40_41890 [Kofleriaceae bacterium]